MLIPGVSNAFTYCTLNAPVITVWSLTPLSFSKQCGSFDTFLNLTMASFMWILDYLQEVQVCLKKVHLASVPTAVGTLIYNLSRINHQWTSGNKPLKSFSNRSYYSSINTRWITLVCLVCMLLLRSFQLWVEIFTKLPHDSDLDQPIDHRI